MKTKHFTLATLLIVAFIGCQQKKTAPSPQQSYYNIAASNAVVTTPLFAISKTGTLDYGDGIAYLNAHGDTVIPFGKFAYFGTDTLRHYAMVLEHPNDSTYGKPIAIAPNQLTIFDLVMYDNGPDYFSEGLTRVSRNGKMGYADSSGYIQIPCIYDYAQHFEGGKAQVTFKAKRHRDLDEHLIITSDEWFVIDKNGNRTVGAP